LYARPTKRFRMAKATSSSLVGSTELRSQLVVTVIEIDNIQDFARRRQFLLQFRAGVGIMKHGTSDARSFIMATILLTLGFGGV
jgi:hypothetical protein